MPRTEVALHVVMLLNFSAKKVLRNESKRELHESKRELLAGLMNQY